METKAIKAAITSIENQLEILKAACGLAPDVGEEHHEDDADDSGETDASESVVKRPTRRGRHQRMPKFEKESD